jgi:DNA-binding MarR family transcriptional regulator
MRAPDDSELEQDFVRAFQRLVGAVFRLNGQLIRTAESLSADLDISTNRWQAIATIRAQPLTVSQIARRIGVSRQSARQTVLKLEQSGLVELQPNPDHRRSQLVALTEAGTEIMEILRERQSRLTHSFTDGLGVTVGSIDRLTDKLEELREHAAELEPGEKGA